MLDGANSLQDVRAFARTTAIYENKPSDIFMTPSSHPLITWERVQEKWVSKRSSKWTRACERSLLPQPGQHRFGT